MVHARPVRGNAPTLTIMWSDRDDDDGGQDDDELRFAEQPGSRGVLAMFVAIALVLIAFGALLALAHW